MTQEPKIFPYIAKLLNDEKVQWKPLGEISSMYGGLTGKNKTDFEEGNASYITYKNIFDNIEIDFSKLEKVKISSSEKQNKVKYGDILFTGSSETAEEAGMSSTITINIEEDIYLNSFSFGVRFDEDVELLPEFTKYLFRSYFMRKSISKTASGVTRFNISKERFKKIPIPIPPLSVQQEIVRILDKFTQLEAELDCRKRQYEYYRNALLSFDDLENRGGYNSLINNKIQYKTLGEVATYVRGLTYNKTNESDEKEGGYKVLRANNINLSSNTLNFDDVKVVKFDTKVKDNQKLYRNDILISAASGSKEHVGKVAFIYEDLDYYFGGFMGVVRCSDKIIPRFLFHILTDNLFKTYLEEVLNSSTINNLNSKIMNMFQIPLPPLSEQQRIATILDKFDTLVNSISEGLPKEIQQRRQQYEYYREQLLTF